MGILITGSSSYSRLVKAIHLITISHPSYPKPAHRAHPLDTSVMEYKGHKVLMTLIRCHFSPGQSTGHSYVYSGSSDGRIHVCVSSLEFSPCSEFSLDMVA